MFQLKVLNANLDDDEVESHAAKLLEIVILQCHNKIDHVLPSLLKIVFERLAREIISTELRNVLAGGGHFGFVYIVAVGHQATSWCGADRRQNFTFDLHFIGEFRKSLCR